MLQLTYTSGKNGWEIERISGDVSKNAAEAFSRVSSQCDPLHVLYAFDVVDGFFVLLHSVPCGVDSVNRPKYYVHGYVFAEDRWEEILNDYALLLGIDYFARSENDALKPAEEVVCSRFKSGVECADLKGLITCVYEALLGKKSLEIRVKNEDKITLIKQIMFVVYSFLPLSLRKFISFSSDGSGIRRTITLVDEYSGMAGLTYDFSSGAVSGANNTYSLFVEKLFGKEKEMYLEKVDLSIRNFSVNRILDEIFYDKIFRDVLPEVEASAFLSGEKLVSQLFRFLSDNRYQTLLGAKLVCSLLSDVIHENLTTSKTFDEKLIDVFSKTESVPLKETIVSHLAEKYIHRSENDFEAFFALNLGNSDLFYLLTEQLLLSGDTAFVSAFAKHYLTGQRAEQNLKANYSVYAVKNLTRAISKRIHESTEKTVLFSQIISSELHSDVMQFLLDVDADEAVLWEYFKIVYASQNAYFAYRQLNAKLFSCLESAFYSLITNYETDALKLLISAYQNLGAERFAEIEKRLAENGCYGLIELFYVNFMIHNAEFSQELESRKNRLKQLGVATDSFVLNSLDKFITLCTYGSEKASDASLSVLKRISDFVGDVPISDKNEFLQLKESFWQGFLWKRFDFSSEDCRIMRLPGNANSDIANSILDFADYVSGKIDALPSATLAKCREVLCFKNQHLSAGEQTQILKQLCRISNDSLSFGVDVYVMLHYSPKNHKVSFKRSGLSVDMLYAYLTGETGEHEMLSVEGVYDSIYCYLKNKKTPANRSGLETERPARNVISMMESAAGKKAQQAQKQFYHIENIKVFVLNAFLTLYIFSAYLMLGNIGCVTAALLSVSTSVLSVLFFNLSFKRRDWMLVAFTVLFICFCVLLHLLILIL